MKKIPLRKCVATREILPKKDLIRIVKNKENKIFIDLTSKQNGRGAYLKKSIQALDIARKKNVLSKVFEQEVSDELYKEVEKIINE